MTRNAPTLGAARLAALGPTAEVARLLSVDPRSIRRWLTGDVPSSPIRFRMSAELGIAWRSWDLPPDASLDGSPTPPASTGLVTDYELARLQLPDAARSYLSERLATFEDALLARLAQHRVVRCHVLSWLYPDTASRNLAWCQKHAETLARIADLEKTLPSCDEESEDNACKK